MQIAPQVRFRGLAATDAIEALCQRETKKLERYYERLTGCRVVVAVPHRSHRKGNLYDVRIALTVPRGEIVVDRSPPAHHASESALCAVREAFDAARRRLQDFARRQDGRTKARPAPGGVRRSAAAAARLTAPRSSPA